MAFRILLVIVLCGGMAAADSVCASGQYSLAALSNSTCSVNGMSLSFGPLASSPSGLDANSYLVTVAVAGNSITFTSPGFSSSSALGTDATLGYSLPLTMSPGGFQVLYTSTLLGASDSVQPCGYAVINGPIVQYGQMWVSSCTSLQTFNTTTASGSWTNFARPLSLSIATNGGSASFSSASLNLQITPIPEPSPVLLLAAGLGPLVVGFRRKLR